MTDPLRIGGGYPLALTARVARAMVPRMTATTLDLTGLKCPLPALKTRKALLGLKAGDRLEVRCTDPMAAIDIPHLVQQTGDRVESMRRADALIVFMIEKTAAGPAQD